jgi:hypothetical protein
MQHAASLVSAPHRLTARATLQQAQTGLLLFFPHPPLPCPRCLSDPRSLHYFWYLKVAGFNYILVLHPSSRGPGSWYLDLLSLRMPTRPCSSPRLSLAQVWGRYRGRVAPSGLPPKKISASIKHTFSFVLATTTKTAARQQTQSLVSEFNLQFLAVACCWRIQGKWRVPFAAIYFFIHAIAYHVDEGL